MTTTMASRSGWRVFFGVAAMFNIAIGLLFLLAPRVAYGLAAAPSPASFEPRLVGWFVGLFGVGYAMVAANPTRHRGLVQLATVGKFGAAALIWAQWRAGAAPLVFALAVVGDVLFAIGFTIFLHRARA